MAKIMLVEDDNNLREIYEARLLAEGHEIISAHDGEEALALAVKEKPELIISDVMMPKISGFDMLDILRSSPETRNTKVIMMTALSQMEDKDRADRLGADRYLVKSQVTLEDVIRVTREVLDGTDESSPVGAPAPVSAEAKPPEESPDTTHQAAETVPVEPAPDPAPEIAVAPEPAQPVEPITDEPASPDAATVPPVSDNSAPDDQTSSDDNTDDSNGDGPADGSSNDDSGGMQPPDDSNDDSPSEGQAGEGATPDSTAPLSPPTTAEPSAEPETPPAEEEPAEPPAEDSAPSANASAASVQTEVSAELSDASKNSLADPINTAESTEAEKQTVEEQIEDFVNSEPQEINISEDGLVTSAPEGSEPEIVVKPLVIPTDVSNSTQIPVSTPEPEPAGETPEVPAEENTSAPIIAPEPITVQPSAPPAPAAVEPKATDSIVETPPAAEAAQESASADPQPASLGKKVIQPIHDPNEKPNLDELVKKEQEKDDISQIIGQAGVTSPEPQNPVSGQQISPQDIAL